MQYRILGPLVVLSEDRQLALGALKDRTVLGVLLLHANEVVPRQRLIEELWGESPPPTAVKAVNGYVSQLRKTLGGNGAAPVVTRPPGYMIEVGRGELDAEQFSVLTSEARARANAAAFGEAATIYAEALSLWRGRALSGIELESVGRHELEQLEEGRITALMDRIDCELALGRHDDLVGELEVLLAEHPLRERLYAQQMLALYRSGRQADALRVYQRARAVLVEELGLEPSPGLQRLERGILNHDPSLQTPSGTAHRNGIAFPAAPAASEAKTRPRRKRRLVLLGGLALVSVAGLVTVALVGRGSAPSVTVTGDGGAVLVVDSKSGDLESPIELRRRPTATASDGERLWLVASDGTLTLATRGSPAIETSIGGALGGVAVGDGSVWATDQDAGTVIRVDPASLEVVDRIRVGNGPSAIAFDAKSGALWVVNRTDGTVSRIDSSRDKVTPRPIPAGASPASLAYGAGSLWVTDEQLGTVTRIDAQTNKPVDTIAFGAAPASIAFGDGSVWVGDAQGGVSRIDPRSDRVVPITHVNTGVDALTTLSGAVWVGGEGSDALWRIDARDGRLDRPVRLGGSVVALDHVGSQVVVTVVRGLSSHRGGTLIAAEGGFDGSYHGPVRLDPATWFDSDGWVLLGATNDGLVTVRRAGGVVGSLIVPDLARSLPLVDTAETTYTFVLRPGLRYSSGRPVLASDVRASIERVWRIRRLATPKEPKGGSLLTDNPDLRLGLVGEEQCAARPRQCDLRDAIVTDDRSGTVTFHLARRNPSFLRLLTTQFYDVLPAATPARDQRVVPATGPYRIAAYVPGHRIVLVRNQQFHPRDGRPDGYPDRILWRLDVPAARAARDVLRGRADYTALPPTATPGAQLRIHHGSQLHVTQQPWLVYLFLNMRIPPFDRAEARRALSEAIDRREVVRAAGGTLAARSTCQIVPPGWAGYQAYCPYTIGANKAGAWLGPNLYAARALVRRSRTAGTKVTVWAKGPYDPLALPLARYVAGVLRSLGYRASPRSVPGEDAGPYYAKVAAPKTRAQIGVGFWSPDFADNTAIFPPQLTCGPPRHLDLEGFCDPDVDRLIRRAGELEARGDQAAASRIWSAVDRRVIDKAPWIPLYNMRTTELVSRRLGNYAYNPQNGFLVDQAWVR